MTFRRRYDIGNGTVIEDDGHHITAVITDGLAQKSKGCPRPFVGGWPDTWEAVVSKCGDLFYLRGITGIDGFWLTKTTWADPSHFAGKGWDYAQFTFAPGKPQYFRGLLPFWCWDVKASPDWETVKGSESHVADFLILIKGRRERDEREFDQFISGTGRNLAWIMERIGGWEPVPKLPDPIPLTD